MSKTASRSHLIYLLALTTLIASGCESPKTSTTQATKSKKGVVPIANATNDDRRADVVFVHGLDGDGVATWTCTSTGFFWPTILGEQVKDIGVWTVSYDANVSDWLGSTMPIEDRSKNLLAQLYASKLGGKPIVFITHTMGGLVVKQMLRDALTTAGDSDKWKVIGSSTRGVVFIGTPNAGSELATALGYLDRLAPFLTKATITQQQLTPNAELLGELNIWYRNKVVENDVKSLVFYENPNGNDVVVVDKSSSDPGISGVTPIRVDGNHREICKPCDDVQLVYAYTKQFIDEDVVPFPTAWEIGFPDFVEQFKSIREDPHKLAGFKAEHVKQQVKWTAVIRSVSPDSKAPTYAIAISDESPVADCVIANFDPKHFRDDLTKGSEVVITGILKDSTNRSGAILDKCRFVSGSNN